MATFTVKGTISYMSEVKSGESMSGNRWQRMTIHLDVPGYQGTITKIVFNVTGNRVDDMLEYSVGDRISVNFSIYAREYNERWYNNLDVLLIQGEEAKSPKPVTGQQPSEDIPIDFLEL